MNGARPRVARPDDTDQSKVALVHERATPRAQTFFNTRARDTRSDTHVLQDTILHSFLHKSTLVYTIITHATDM